MKKLFISVSVISVMLLSSCSGEKEKQPAELPAIAVKVSEVSGNPDGKYISASGKIEAVNHANISTRMMGYITSIKVKLGQNVSAGQLLATISSSDLQAKKAQAEAGVTQATAAYNNAKKDHDRYVNLFAQKSITQKEMDDMATHLEMAKAGLEAANQMKNEVLAQFSYSNITAPFSGVITGTFAKEGDMANPGMPILSLEGKSKLQAVVMVSESDISGIKQGMTAVVNIKSLNKTVNGKVTEVSFSSLNTGGQYLVKLDLDNSTQLLSGMFVNATFSAERNTSAAPVKSGLVLIPQEALISQGQLKGVYVIGAGNTAILRWLRTGKTFGNQVEVLSGLVAGEQYIVQADGRLFNGSKVSIR